MNRKNIGNPQSDKESNNDVVVASKKKQKLGLILAASILIIVIIVGVALFIVTAVSDNHTVSFDSTGGSDVENIEMTEDGRLSQLPKPTRDGFIFDGWYVSDTDKWSDNNVVEEDTELFAKWRVTISYDTNGGGEIASYTVIEGSEIVAPNAPVKDALVFAAWYNGDTRWDFETHTADNNITLKAVWNLRVTFDTQGGTAVGVQGVASGDKIIEPAKTSTYKGRSFKGWYYNDVEWDFTTGTITESITLVAQWEVSVTFDSDGGSREKTQTFAPGGKVTVPTETPTKDGYIFDGWYLGDVKWDFSTVVQTNKKLEAKWIKNHKIDFIIEGNEVVPIYVEDKGKVTDPEVDTSKVGFNFIGWFYENEDGKLVKWDFEVDVVTSDLTLTATWEEVSVEVIK